MGKFVVSKRVSGDYQFSLKAPNGQEILWSEGHSDLSSLKNGIESARKNSQDSEMFRKRKSGGGKFYFNLMAQNGRIVGSSNLYESEAARDNGIASVMKNAPDAEIENEFS